MSSILPFVVVAVILGVVAQVTLDAATQPATEGDANRRDPWYERLRAFAQRLARSARRAGAWIVGAVATARTSLNERREQRRVRREDDAAAEAAASEEPTVVRTPAPTSDVSSDPVVRRPTAPPPDGVVATALRVSPDIAFGDVVGEDVNRVGPSPLARLRSVAGLVGLIVVLGLALATILGALAAVVSAALDSFVN